MLFIEVYIVHTSYFSHSILYYYTTINIFMQTSINTNIQRVCLGISTAQYGVLQLRRKTRKSILCGNEYRNSGYEQERDWGNGW